MGELRHISEAVGDLVDGLERVGVLEGQVYALQDRLQRLETDLAAVLADERMKMVAGEHYRRHGGDC